MIKFRNKETGIIQELPEKSFEFLMQNPRWADRLEFIETINTAKNEKEIKFESTGGNSGPIDGTGNDTGTTTTDENKQPVNAGKKATGNRGRKKSNKSGE